MRIEDFYNQPLSGTPLQQGVESDWLDLCELPIPSGKLSMGDPLTFPRAQVKVRVVGGTYKVQAKVFDYGNHRRISRLRACLEEDPYDVLEIDEFPVDAGMAAVCEYPTFKAARKAAFEADPTLDDNFYERFMAEEFGVIKLGEPPAPIAYVMSGWGDGWYTVFVYLDEHGRKVGCETVFINDDRNVFANLKDFHASPTEDDDENTDNSDKQQGE
jgi:hypothetical protein